METTTNSDIQILNLVLIILQRLCTEHVLSGILNLSHWSDWLSSFQANSKDLKKQPKSNALDCNTDDVAPPSSHPTAPRSACLSSKSCAELPSQNLPSSCVAPNPPDRNSAACQTSQSSLLPCDACHQAQSALRRTGDALVGLFQSEGLASSLQPLLAAGKDLEGHMTEADISQWAHEHLRDVGILEKHLQDVRDAAQPLGKKLEEAEAEVERFRTQLTQTQRRCKQELEKHQANIVQLEFSLNKAQRSVKATEAGLQEEQQQHKRGGETSNNHRSWGRMLIPLC